MGGLEVYPANLACHGKPHVSETASNRSEWVRLWAVPCAVAVFTFLGVVYAIDPVGNYPGLATGPGITIDEPFNVQQGVRLAVGVPEWSRGGLTTAELWGEAEDVGPNPPLGLHLADHPPLARFWLGVSHQIGLQILPPVGAGGPIVTASARLGSAFAFAIMVLLVGRVTSGWYGWRGGAVATGAVVLMPRGWGHAHIAALETVLGLVWVVAVLHIACRWRPSERISAKTAAVSGLLFGLVLLTKIQAILLPIPVACWALWHWRWAAIRPLAVFGGCGFVVFLVGWPWLWLDPVGHLVEYFGRTTDRATLYVTYYGTRFADREVPWHYPFVMFALTVPLGLQALGMTGCLGRRRDVEHSEPKWITPAEQLVLACIVFPLAVFALPGVVVYDGCRLFLVVYPLWAVLVGRGAAVVLEWLDLRFNPTRATATLAVFVTLQGYAIVALCPCHLSYYNLLIGGSRGAERLGLQTTYWAEPLTRELLDEIVEVLPRGGRVHVSPVMHPLYAPYVNDQSPSLRRAGVSLVDFNDPNAGRPELLLVHERWGDWPDGLAELVDRGEVLAEVRRGGIRVAAFVRVSDADRAE